MPSKKSPRLASQRTRSRAPRRAVKAVSKQKQIAADIRAGIPCLCAPDDKLVLNVNSSYPRVAIRRGLGIPQMADLDNPRACRAIDAFESVYKLDLLPFTPDSLSPLGYTECIVALELAALVVEEGGVE